MNVTFSALGRSNRARWRKPEPQNVKRVENWKLLEPNFGTMAPGTPKSVFGFAVQSWSVLLAGFTKGPSTLYCTLSTTFCWKFG